MTQRIELIGGPFDGQEMEVPATSSYVQCNYPDGLHRAWYRPRTDGSFKWHFMGWQRK